MEGKIGKRKESGKTQFGMNVQRKAQKRAQLKVQETAFMLLALAFFLILVLIFYSNFQLKQLYSEYGSIQSEQAVSLLDKFIALPEFSCMHGRCVDLDKVLALGNITGYDDLWKGLSKVELVRIYPSQRRFLVYQKAGAGAGVADTVSYGAPVPLCKTRYVEGYVWQECSLAQLLVSIEKAKLGNR